MTESTNEQRDIRCAKKGLKIGLTLTFIATSIIVIVAPDYAGIVAVVSASSNTVWLWEV